MSAWNSPVQAARGKAAILGRLGAPFPRRLLLGGILGMKILAQADAITPVNLCNNAYFNLCGAGSTTALITVALNHRLLLEVEECTAMDGGLIPTGELLPVSEAALDFREPHAIGCRIAALIGTGAKGYEHNFVSDAECLELKRAPRIVHVRNGRWLAVWTTEPGIRIYPGNPLGGHFLGGKVARVG
ncbi:MAG: aldose 1-epimerase [Planctomycetota bacterium]